MTKFTTRNIFLSVFPVFFVLGPCGALECYYCFPYGNTCADPLNTTQAMIKECPAMCLTEQIDGNFTRGCAPAQVLCEAPICSPDYCYQCCDDEDLCNGQPLVPPGESSVCYSCLYESNTGEGAACTAEPFDPNGVGVSQQPCYGACTVMTGNPNGIFSVYRGCAHGVSPGLPCESGCGSTGPIDYCRSCCEGVLCNNGPPPSLQQPSTQGVGTSPPDVGLPSPTSQGPAFAPDAALMILGIAALYLAAS